MILRISTSCSIIRGQYAAYRDKGWSPHVFELHYTIETPFATVYISVRSWEEGYPFINVN